MHQLDLLHKNVFFFQIQFLFEILRFLLCHMPQSRKTYVFNITFLINFFPLWNLDEILKHEITFYDQNLF